jgi:hypothetical protein
MINIKISLFFVDNAIVHKKDAPIHPHQACIKP